MKKFILQAFEEATTTEMMIILMLAFIIGWLIGNKV